MNETNKQPNPTGEKLDSKTVEEPVKKKKVRKSKSVKNVVESSATPTVESTPKMSLLKKILMIQLEMKAISKDQKGYGYNYFDINQIIEELKPLLKKFGVLIMQPLTHIEGKAAIETIVMSSDERMSWITPLPTNSLAYETKNGQRITETDPQKMGAVITYYRRYALQSLFMLQAEDPDAVNRKKASKVAPEKTQSSQAKIDQIKKNLNQ